MSAVKHVLIIGGGVAGLALAIRLSHYEIVPEIVEVRPEWTAAGTGISLQGPALRALRDLGVLDRCIETGFGYSELILCDVRGRRTATVDLPRLLGPEYPATLGLWRETLHQVLREKLAQSPVKVRLGVTVTELTLGKDAVTACFTDGTSGRYDLVVGADGANSIVRDILFGTEQRPHYTGQVNWRATVRRPDEVRARHSFYGPRHKAGFNPVSASHMYIYLLENAQEPPRWPAEQALAVMRERLADFGGLLGAAREEIREPEQVIYRPTLSGILSPPWHVGHAIVIGDAAHTTTPQLASGAGIAIEDAIVLAELLQSETRVQDALEAFMRRRFARCRMVVENSQQLGEWEKNPSAPDVDFAGMMDRSLQALAQPA